MWLLLPLKDFVLAKQRLSGLLSVSERRALFQAMVEDVLAKLQSLDWLQQVVIVSEDPAAGLLAEHFDALCWSETELGARGLNPAVAAAAVRAADCGASSILVVHGDLPALKAAELSELRLKHLQLTGAAVTLATDRHERGSNVLILSPPNAVQFCYGENSARNHAASALARGSAFQQFCLPSLGRDIDTFEDLLEFMRETETGAHSTRQYLLRTGILQRIELALAENSPNDSGVIADG